MIASTGSAMPKPNLNYEEQSYDGATAQRWLARHAESINRKWTTVRVHRLAETRQALKDETGKVSNRVIPARFLVVFSRDLFGLFGRTEETSIEFQEADILSILYRKDSSFTLFGEDHHIEISLKQAQIELSRSPAFSGKLRREENVRIQFPFKTMPAD